MLYVFNELRLGVEEDVKAINQTAAVVRREKSALGIRSNSVGDYFVVFRAANSSIKVEFNCERDGIKVNKGAKEFAVTLTLDKQGRCRFRIDGGEELEQWQVRHFMLEELFFGTESTRGQK